MPPATKSKITLPAVPDTLRDYSIQHILNANLAQMAKDSPAYKQQVIVMTRLNEIYTEMENWDYLEVIKKWRQEIGSLEPTQT